MDDVHKLLDEALGDCAEGTPHSVDENIHSIVRDALANLQARVAELEAESEGRRAALVQVGGERREYLAKAERLTEHVAEMEDVLAGVLEAVKVAEQVGCIDYWDPWADREEKWYAPIKKARAMLLVRGGGRFA